jgi:hypothetical protein
MTPFPSFWALITANSSPTYAAMYPKNGTIAGTTRPTDPRNPRNAEETSCAEEIRERATCGIKTSYPHQYLIFE